MFWTAIYFLILLGVGCWYLFEWYFPTKKLKAFYSSPSDAIIDQCLPDEILEHVMTFLDCQTVLNCRSVSKHWKYQASKENVLKEVLYNQRRYNRRQFCEKISNHKIVLQELENDVDTLESQLRDHMFAATHGAKLLELTGTSLLAVKNILAASEKPLQDFLLKVIGTHGFTEISWDLHDRHGYKSYTNYEMPVPALMPRIKPRFGQDYYLFINLHNYLYTTRKPIRVLWIRTRKQLPEIAGFIPMTGSSPRIFFLYLIVCLFHDWWISSLRLGFWFALLTYASSTFFYVLVLSRLSFKELRIKARIFGAFHIIGLPILTYSYFVRFCQFKGTVLLALACFLMQDNLKRDKILRQKHHNMVVATILTLFLTIFDWQLILDKFADGTMWKVLLLNTICYLGICWEVLWINFGHLWADTKNPTLGLLFKWQPSIVWGLAKLSIIIVITSFYYPVPVM